MKKKTHELCWSNNASTLLPSSEVVWTTPPFCSPILRWRNASLLAPPFVSTAIGNRRPKNYRMIISILALNRIGQAPARERVTADHGGYKMHTYVLQNIVLAIL